MTDSYRNPAAAFLSRAGLLVGLLAIIAGIFGMHVVTGIHSGHSTGAVATAIGAGPAGSAAADDHHVHPESGTTAAHQVTGDRDAANIKETAGASAQMCSSTCCGTAAHTMAGSCIPSVKTISLAPPAPGNTLFGALAPTGTASTVRGDCQHVPGTPSPGELSISRT